MVSTQATSYLRPEEPAPAALPDGSSSATGAGVSLGTVNQIFFHFISCAGFGLPNFCFPRAGEYCSILEPRHARFPAGRKPQACLRA